MNPRLMASPGIKWTMCTWTTRLISLPGDKFELDGFTGFRVDDVYLVGSSTRSDDEFELNSFTMSHLDVVYHVEISTGSLSSIVLKSVMPSNLECCIFLFKDYFICWTLESFLICFSLSGNIQLTPAYTTTVNIPGIGPAIAYCTATPTTALGNVFLYTSIKKYVTDQIFIADVISEQESIQKIRSMRTGVMTNLIWAKEVEVLIPV